MDGEESTGLRKGSNAVVPKGTRVRVWAASWIPQSVHATTLGAFPLCVHGEDDDAFEIENLDSRGEPTHFSS